MISKRDVRIQSSQSAVKILRIKTEYVQVSSEPVRGLKEVE